MSNVVTIRLNNLHPVISASAIHIFHPDFLVLRSSWWREDGSEVVGRCGDRRPAAFQVPSLHLTLRLEDEE